MNFFSSLGRWYYFFSRLIKIFFAANNIYGEVLTEGQPQDKSLFAFFLIQWPNQLC